MPILDLQRRWRELGRLRLGSKGETTKDGKKVYFPKKLAEFRLTSASEELLTVAAEMYGGEVRKWEGAPTEGTQWEVFTGADRLDVIVPPGEPLTAHWELWSGGGCERRCDGRAQTTGEPCACPADLEQRGELAQKGKACKATTRLSVILPRVPDIGVWRVETHGLNAAVELPGTVDILRRALDEGSLVPAQLRIDQRTSKKNGQTQHFVVPVLELPTVTTGQLMAGEAPGVQALDAGRQRQLPAAAPVAIGPGGSSEVASPPPPAPASKKATASKKAAARPPADPPLDSDNASPAEVAALAARIQALSPEAQREVRAAFERAKLPTDQAQLLARHMKKANAVVAGIESAHPAGPPATNVDGLDPERPFTAEDDAADSQENFDRRKRWVMAEMAKVPACDGDRAHVDAVRHALVREATKGAKQSSAELTEAEAKAVVALVADAAAGRIELFKRLNGGIEVRPVRKANA